jgi:hypothetical protein
LFFLFFFLAELLVFASAKPRRRVMSLSHVAEAASHVGESCR